MREIKKVDWYYLDMQELAKITEEVYGKKYDVQMGEYPNGSYLVTSSDPDYRYADSDGYYEVEGDYSSEFIELTNEESIQRWIDAPPPDNKYDRDLESQPSLWVILSDLAVRGEIPIGDYFISIDW